jgi:hypothetical protein
MSWHTQAMNTIIEPDKQNRIVLTREIRNAAPDLETVIS